MHADEVSTDENLVRQLLETQFPQWADLPITTVRSTGTDNAIYHLGAEMSVRLPRIGWATGQVDKEHTWLPKLAPQLPLEIPVPIARGEPTEDYPYPWSVQRWLNGENISLEQISDPCKAALKLAQFIVALQAIDTEGGLPAKEHNVRGLPLIHRDEATRAALTDMTDMIDTSLALEIWQDALSAPEWQRDPVCFHGDMLRGNLLFTNGKLSAVIDFGGLAVGDPACDLMIAWNLFAGESRDVFRAALGVDDATWCRARGHALSQAIIFIPYYLHSNPVGVAYARQSLQNVFTDFYESGT